MRIVFVQYGDYGAAVRNFAQGGAETYAAQRYSVDFVAGLTRQAEQVSVICVDADPYSEQLSNGVRASGMRLYKQATEADLVAAVARERPTHLVSRSPIRPLIRWGGRNGVRTFPSFATSFPKGSWRTAVRYFQLARLLNSDRFPWIGNHAINSCRDLERIGVRTSKIVPWDWPPATTPDAFTAKRLDPGRNAIRLFYAGVIRETKGIGDCIAAIKLLREKGIDASLSVAGSGEVDLFRARAAECGVSGAVEFLGRIPHLRVVAMMHEHDVVVVPSQYGYPEGLPLTIYDAYCSRSPLVASDHPMFRGRVHDGQSALVFRAGNPVSLAERVEELLREPELYAQLSQASAAAWEKLQLPVKWGVLMTKWLENSPEANAWLASHSLASGRYDS
jgi:glycosyltransferase involved in cell wall biosynthesis